MAYNREPQKISSEGHQSFWKISHLLVHEDSWPKDYAVLGNLKTIMVRTKSPKNMDYPGEAIPCVYFYFYYRNIGLASEDTGK